MLARASVLLGLLICCGTSAAVLDGAGARGVNGAAAATAVGDTAKARLAIEGMTCGSCATTARIALERAPGVYDAKVSYDSASAVVLYDPRKTTPEKFAAHLEKMTGYRARVVQPADKATGTS